MPWNVLISQPYNFDTNIFLFIQNSGMLRNILETDQPYYLSYILDTFLKSNWQLGPLFNFWFVDWKMSQRHTLCKCYGCHLQIHRAIFRLNVSKFKLFRTRSTIFPIHLLCVSMKNSIHVKHGRRVEKDDEKTHVFPYMDENRTHYRKLHNCIERLQ